MTTGPSIHPAFTLRALGRRIRHDAWLKATGTSLGMTAFFAAYFAILRHPVFPSFVIPATWLDSLVGVQPWALLPYISLWFYIGLLPALLIERRQLWGYACGCAVLAAAGLSVFLIWPTSTPPADVEWARYPYFQFLKQADASGNACPSLHVAFAVFTALWFVRLLPALGAGRVAQAANAVWALLIVHSTLATKQHVALDAYAGAILGAWVASLNFIAVPPPPGSPFSRLPLFAAVAVIKLSALLLWFSGLGFGWCLALFLTGGALVLYHLFAPGAGELVRVFTRFETSAREVWLTLDDGPDPDDTPRILELLARHRARATFFLIGERAARHPALVASIGAHGHEIAHHTHTHPLGSFWCASPARVQRELDDGLAVFAAAGTPPTRRFRAPVGFKNLFLAPALDRRGLRCVAWTIRSGDTFATDPAAVAARVAARLRPGAIILMHEGPPLRAEVRVAALAGVLAALDAQGYRAVIPADAALR